MLGSTPGLFASPHLHLDGPARYPQERVMRTEPCGGPAPKTSMPCARDGDAIVNTRIVAALNPVHEHVHMRPH